MSERSAETDGEEDTLALAREVAATLRGGDVVHLFGDLGTGKTRFVKGLAEGLGIDPAEVHSPSFTLVETHAPGSAGLGLVHVDLYRIADVSELRELGLEEMPGPGAVAAIEWAERLPPGEEPSLRVRIADLGGDRRRIDLEWCGR